MTLNRGNWLHIDLEDERQQESSKYKKIILAIIKRKGQVSYRGKNKEMRILDLFGQITEANPSLAREMCLILVNNWLQSSDILLDQLLMMFLGVFEVKKEGGETIYEEEWGKKLKQSVEEWEYIKKRVRKHSRPEENWELNQSIIDTIIQTITSLKE